MKVHIATEVKSYQGSGYVLGGSYRPRTENEATDYINAERLFLDDQPEPTYRNDSGALVTMDPTSFRGPL